MAGTQDTEPFNEWEQVESPVTHNISPTAQSREWEMVIDNNLHQDGLSVFPPSNHEGLQIPPPQQQQKQPEDSQASDPPSSIGSNLDSKEEERLPSDSRPKVGNETWKIMRSGICWIASRVRCYLVFRGGFWSIASVTLLAAAAVLLYTRMQRWRQWVREERNSRLTFLIKEKDQKIIQLLLQIAQVNETLSARRRVQVIRVG